MNVIDGKKNYQDDIIGWYDVNNGYNGSVLMDLSKNANSILLDENIKIGMDELNQDFIYLYASTNSVISIPISLKTNTFWTAIHYVGRYNGNDKGSIISDTAIKFFLGFYESNSGVCYLNENRVSEFEKNVYQDQWVLSSFYFNEYNQLIYCSQNCETFGLTDNQNINIQNLQINGEHNTDYAFAEMIIVKMNYPMHFHPLVDTMCIEEYLSNKYRINSYRYTATNIIALQWSHWMFLIAIILSGLFALFRFEEHAFKFKSVQELSIYQSQTYPFCCYCCCKRCYCCCVTKLCRINCCCGAIRGICLRHCCGCAISILPVYNIFSVIASLTSIVIRIIRQRYETCLYLLLNGLCTMLATIVHFIFIHQYLVGNVRSLEDNSFFYFIEFEVCIFLWCIMVIDCLRNYTKDIYWIILFTMYAYLITVLVVTIRMYYADSLIIDSMYIVPVIQIVFMIATPIICYYCNILINYSLYFIRSLLLFILSVFTIAELYGWNDVYTVWFFSLVLIQYMNLYLGDFVASTMTEPKEYKHLNWKRKSIFKDMISMAKYNVFDELYPYGTDSKICNDKPEFEDNIAKLFEMDTCWININKDNFLLPSTHMPQNYKDSNHNYISLNHEYQSNKQYCFDESLLSYLRETATYFQSKEQNYYFNVEEILAILIFVKFSSFRFLFYQDLLTGQTDFIYFQQLLQFIDQTSAAHFYIEEQTGYTILNSQIKATVPIIFSTHLTHLLHFHTLTNNKYQGSIFRVSVTGKYVPLSLIGDEFYNIRLVTVPTHIMYEVDSTVLADQETKAFSDIRKSLFQIIQQYKTLISNEILTKLLTKRLSILNCKSEIVFGQEEVIKLFSELMLNLTDENVCQDILSDVDTILADIDSTIVFHMILHQFINNKVDIQAMMTNINMKDFLWFFWTQFVNGDIKADSVTKLRKICQQAEKSQVFAHSGAERLYQEMTNKKKENNLQRFLSVINEEIIIHMLTLSHCQNFDESEKNMSHLIASILFYLKDINILIKYLFDGNRVRLETFFSFMWLEFSNNNISEKQINKSRKLLIYVFNDTDLEKFDAALTQTIESIIELYETNDDFTALTKRIKKIRGLITNPILTKLITSYRGDNVDKSQLELLTDYLLKPNDIHTMIYGIIYAKKREINMTEFFGMVWLDFVNKNIDKMAIIKLRAFCQKNGPQQALGKSLLEYKCNAILNDIPEDIKYVNWAEHIQQYIYRFTTGKIQSLSNTPISKNQNMQQFLHIMTRYDQILNSVTNAYSKQEQELRKLLQIINKEFNMSQLMDNMLHLQRANVEYLAQMKKDHECKWNECEILESVVKTRTFGLRSRIQGTNVNRNSNQHFGLNLTLEEFCMMELLDFIHIRLCHKEENYRKRLPNTAGIDTIECAFNNGNKENGTINSLFMDSVKLSTLTTFCDENHYDSEAFYDDIFSDEIEQSNLYRFFKQNIKHKIKEFDVLKDHIYGYLINPPDKQAIDRNLIDLDFGDHVKDWNIKPKFFNMKEEWMENEFFPIEEDIYESVKYKSSIIANQNHNKTTYKFFIDDILCIKMYTDTNELQTEFRKAFRSTSDTNRRSQFIHWATNLSVIFLKIEVSNHVYNYNEDICNVTLYHGLNRLFNTRGLVRQFHGALSTTWELQVARNFAGNKGMILQINKDVNNKNDNALAVDWISCHDNEQEVLLMNPQVIIQKSYLFSQDIHI
eukprot:244211_1